MVLEKWPTAVLAGRGGDRGLVGGGRAAREVGSAHTNALQGGRSGGKGAGKDQRSQGQVEDRNRSNEGGTNTRPQEHKGDLEEAGEEQSWAQVVKGRGKMATRPKAAAAPPNPRKDEKMGGEEEEEQRSHGEDEELTVAPRYTLPIPRTLMEGRIGELRKLVQELEAKGPSRKLRRAKARLEDVEEDFREAGGV